jgi:hypothetical protein
MSRVYELIDLIADPLNPCAYFQNFDDSICDEPEKKRVWLAREQEFQRLDTKSWQSLKNEAVQYLMTRDAKRGWQQLIDILNQARAHNYLIDEGCTDIRFIPRSKTDGEKTPDLEGMLSGTKVICEVKTINISDVEAICRKNRDAGITANSLDKGFFSKLMSDLSKAESQMKSYYGGQNARRIAFIVPNFDDFLGEYKSDYFEQIDQHLAINRPSVNIVFYNQRTCFHYYILMKNAVVVNESG